MNPSETTSTNGLSALDALRRFARPRPQPAAHRCELCALPLADEHLHLYEPAARQLVCCCDACSMLFPGQQQGRFRRVPRRIVALDDFSVSNEVWSGFHLPINLAFFVERENPRQMIAAYPSPAGAVESPVDDEPWQQLVHDHPALAQLEPEVEALLVNRVGARREYYLAPIDVCFNLVGLIRMSWRGLSGGSKVWIEIAKFFDGLQARAQRSQGGQRAS
ncbi:MAG TPA: DUF5947 family protein [Pirellulales bacterium]|jgi:hypothetical protein|nr:DUF5947 family protein [Pirellulales bacterium]